MNLINSLKIGIVTLVFFSGCSFGNPLLLQGKIALKGPATHSYLVIEDELTKKSYRIQNQASYGLINKQNHTIKIKARLLKKAIGRGFPAVIKVLVVEEL